MSRVSGPVGCVDWGTLPGPGACLRCADTRGVCYGCCVDPAVVIIGDRTRGVWRCVPGSGAIVLDAGSCGQGPGARAVARGWCLGCFECGPLPEPCVISGPGAFVLGTCSREWAPRGLQRCCVPVDSILFVSWRRVSGIMVRGRLGLGPGCMVSELLSCQDVWPRGLSNMVVYGCRTPRHEWGRISRRVPSVSGLVSWVPPVGRLPSMGGGPRVRALGLCVRLV